MSSSTSNFERITPEQNWKTNLIAVSILLMIFIISWEAYWRSKGYQPTLNDDRFLWAKIRHQVTEKDVVLIGSSRTLFDIDLSEFSKGFNGVEPKQLSIVGASPIPVLGDFADDPDFKGLLICGVVPGLYFAPAGPPMNKPTKWVKAYKHFSPNDIVALQINQQLQSQFAFIQQEDLPLKELVKKYDLPNRTGTIVYPKLPPYFYSFTSNREAKMISKVVTNKEFAGSIQQGWLKLFTPPPFPGKPTREEIHKMIAGIINGKIEFSKNCVEKIRKRGGDVIFIRLPSSGALRGLESKLSPRVACWDRLISETKTIGIHFEDHDTLKNFACPEWSHLNADDSVKFTKAFMTILKRKQSLK